MNDVALSGVEGAHILLVEDEAVIRLAVEDQLLRMGAAGVRMAHDHDSALAELGRGHVDLVLMDVNLGAPPDGIHTAAAILARVDVPIVFLTAYATEEVIRRALSVAPYGYLFKPIDETSLRVTLDLAIERHRDDVSLRLLRMAVDQAPIGVVLVDVAGDERSIGYVNEAFARMVGVPASALTGRPPCTLAARPEDPEVQRLTLALTERGEAQELVEGRHPDGRRFVSRVSVAPARSRAGVTTHMVMLHADVTAERDAQDAAAARQRDELVGRLAAGVAHDFNNLLAVIRSYADLAQEQASSTELSDDVGAIVDATRRGAQLTRRLLALAKPLGEASSTRAIELGESLERLLPLSRQMAGRMVKVSLQRPSSPVFVGMDGVSFEQVVLNLVGNARDAMPGGGTIHMEVALRPGAVEVRVTDSGVGIDEQLQKRVFEPYFTTKGSGGTGLGLWTCRLLVERVGGRIFVRSQSGTGATFVVELPVLEAPLGGEVRAPETRGLARVSGVTCLVVDDDATLGRAYARALGSAGFVVAVAHSARQARAELARWGDDLQLLVTDLDLGGESGAELIAELSRTSPKAAAVLVSGYVDGEDLQLAAHVHVLWKPFALDALVDVAVRVTLPDVPASAAQRASTRPPPPQSPLPADAELPKVLIVDDDETVRGSLAAVLRARALHVVEADTVTAAVTAIDAHRFDALVVEMNLGAATGFDVVEAARRHDVDVPAVVITGAPSLHVAKLALRHRVSALLAKPFANAELAGEVDRALRAVQIARVQRKMMRLTPEVAGMLDDLPSTAERFEASLAGMFVVYQPIVRAFDGRVFAREALLRSRGPLAQPQAFLAAAEALGRIEELGRAVRRRVAGDVDRWGEDGAGVFVNLHPREFNEGLLAADEPLVEHARRVVLEVTERAQLASDGETRATADLLRGVGYRVALDDLGEGYAGLNWLSKLEPEFVKLDIELVRGLDVAPIKREIVAAMATLCRRAQTTIIAKGVESEAEARVLRTLGCDLLQGYLYGRPAALT